MCPEFVTASAITRDTLQPSPTTSLRRCTPIRRKLIVTVSRRPSLSAPLFRARCTSLRLSSPPLPPPEQRQPDHPPTPVLSPFLFLSLVVFSPPSFSLPPSCSALIASLGVVPVERISCFFVSESLTVTHLSRLLIATLFICRYVFLVPLSVCLSVCLALLFFLLSLFLSVFSPSSRSPAKALIANMFLTREDRRRNLEKFEKFWTNVCSFTAFFSAEDVDRIQAHCSCVLLLIYNSHSN